MRLRFLLLFLFPALLCGAAPKAVVQVTAIVPLVVEVEGPAQVVLAPGEVARIRVGVAANVPWVLGVHSSNAWVTVSAPLHGPAGSASSNRQEVEVSCSSRAIGAQAVTLLYTVMPR